MCHGARTPWLACDAGRSCVMVDSHAISSTSHRFSVIMSQITARLPDELVRDQARRAGSLARHLRISRCSSGGTSSRVHHELRLPPTSIARVRQSYDSPSG